MNDIISKEACHTLSVLITALGVGLSINGLLNVLEGSGSSISQAQELGEKQMKVGRYLVIFAVYIEKGIMPPPEILEYISLR